MREINLGDVYVVEWLKPKLKNGVLIEGLPGIGNVGKIVTDYLIKELKAEKVCEVYSFYFPDRAIVEVNGVFRLPRDELYLYEKERGEGIILLTGDYQPPMHDLKGHYRVARVILDLAVEYGCKTVITVAGLQSTTTRLVPDVYVVANDRELLERLSGYGFKKNKHGRIFGAAGLLLSLSAEKGLKAFCILATTRGNFSDYLAAYHVLLKLKDVLDIKVDLAGMEREAEKVRMYIEGILGKRTEEEERKPPEYIG